MHRLFIVLPVYAVVVIFLPRQDWFMPIADYVGQIDPDVSFWTSMSLGAAAVLGLWVMRNRPFNWMLRRPRVAEVIGSALVGLVIPAIFDLFERLAGQSTNLINVILLPIGFAISETVWQAVQWRMQRRQEQDSDEV